MKSLIKNYVNKLTKEKIDKFAKKHDIFLNENELNYLLNFIKSNINDLLKNDESYLDEVKRNITYNNYNKILNLHNYYKNKYKGYLF